MTIVIHKLYVYRVKNVNYKQLEAFRTTMRTGSVTAAAKALLISQPSISRLLKKLENSIGVQLFHHQKTHISFWVRSSRRISEWVAAYQLDLGIVISYYDRPSISILDKVKSNFVAVMPTNHPLAKLKRLDWDDIKNETLISIEFYIIHAEHRKPSLAVELFLPILGKTIEHICAKD